MLEARVLGFKRQALTDQVYDLLKKLIVEQVYSPDVPLRIEEVASHLDVSITPVRQALNRLWKERLVTYEPMRGFRTAPFADNKRIREFIQVSSCLHSEAAKLGAATVTDPEVEQMEEACAGIEEACQARGYEAFRSFHHWDLTFHRLVMATSRNSVLLELYESVDTQMATVFYRAFVTGDIVAIHQQIKHQPILEAYRLRDPDTVVKAVQEHHRSAIECWPAFADLGSAALRKHHSKGGDPSRSAAANKAATGQGGDRAGAV